MELFGYGNSIVVKNDSLHRGTPNGFAINCQILTDVGRVEIIKALVNFQTGIVARRVHVSFTITLCCTGNLLTMLYTLAFVLISVAEQFIRKASAPTIKFNFSSLFLIYFNDGGFFGFAS